MITHYQNIEGHFNFEKIYFDEVKQSSNGDNFLEIGCYLGKSTAYLAETIKESGKDITIHVVDTFKGSSEKPLLPFLSQFKANMEKYGLLDVIKIYEGTSDFFSSSFEEEFFDFIYVDGNHDNIKSDILNYLPKIKKGKTFAGHDYQHEAVRDNVNKILGKEKLTFHNNTWIFKP